MRRALRRWTTCAAVVLVSLPIVVIARADDTPQPSAPTPDLPIATDDATQQPPPPAPDKSANEKSAPIATAPPPKEPVSSGNDPRSNAMMAFATLGLAPIVSRTTAAGDADGGGLAGFRAFMSGFDAEFAFHVDFEARVGGGSDGFLTRDRATLLFGSDVRINDLGAFTLRAGGEARYVRSGLVEYGRLFAPAAELGVYRFGSRDSKKLQIDLSAIGGLAAYTSLRADNNVAFDRSLAFGTGGSLAVGARHVLGRLSYLRSLGERWSSDIDAVLCAGEYIAACLELDHVIVNRELMSGGMFTTWRALLSLGIGIAFAE